MLGLDPTFPHLLSFLLRVEKKKIQKWVAPDRPAKSNRRRRPTGNLRHRTRPLLPLLRRQRPEPLQTAPRPGFQSLFSIQHPLQLSPEHLGRVLCFHPTRTDPPLLRNPVPIHQPQTQREVVLKSEELKARLKKLEELAEMKA
ncbi:hypothetical protein Tsubulata_031926 [Turnera subulata]|uniref:Uncharacterized protein n=1 Tax=Turnera subulata TaxID=218843 RepID=A0A9Q0FQQ2_9ROSI|nr:hypothetical protein Tsubulata_031926 [Turnera subulata]